MKFLFNARKKGHNLIFLRDMIVEMQVGVFNHEKGRTQRVRITIEAVPLVWPDSKSDQIEDTVSYDDFYKIVEKVTSGPHIHLVETIAENIAELCLAQCAIKEIFVKIEKPDIYPNAISGVAIKRKKILK